MLCAAQAARKEENQLWGDTSQLFIVEGNHLCNVTWFAETSDFAEVQRQWPRLTKEAQRYIACFETLAQQCALHGSLNAGES